MIAQLSGDIVAIRENHIVLDVNGVGYLLAVTEPHAYTEGSTTTLYTYLAVRENALDLYGFQSSDVLFLFEELIKLQKIGPKTALQILSQADVQTIKKSVQMDDPAYLSKVSGIGKKSAEKIVAGLKDVLDIEDLAELGSETIARDSDVIETLITLGYGQREALAASQKVPADIESTQDRVKHALKYIGE